MNYIPLNQVTHQIAYPIPHCDCAVNLALGIALFICLFDAPTGYHQLAVSPETQENLAFQDTDMLSSGLTWLQHLGQLTFPQLSFK